MKRKRMLSKIAVIFVIAAMLMQMLPAMAYATSAGDIITTVAGTGSYGYSGDGGEAINAELAWPLGMAVDPDGNLYIDDYDNYCVRKVDADGIITTVAGDGTSGSSGDGGPATAARLSGPGSVAFDSSGNMYIADSGNVCVRKVDTDGVITTVANDPQFSLPISVAVDNNDDLYIADRSNNCVFKMDSDGNITTVAGTPGESGYSGDGGPATAAKLNAATSISYDGSGNLFIADPSNNVVRKVENGSGEAAEPGLSLWAWGENDSGQLGDGTATARNTSAQIGDSDAWQAIATGDKHTVAIKADGSLWAWGLNDYGNLGDGTTTTLNTPAQIGADTDWKALAVGKKHTIAIKNDGSLCEMERHFMEELFNDFKSYELSLLSDAIQKLEKNLTEMGPGYEDKEE